MTALLWALALALAVGVLWALYRRPPEVTLRREGHALGFQGSRLPVRVVGTLRTRLPTRFVLEFPAPRSVVPDLPLVLAGEVRGEWEGEVAAELSLNRRGPFTWPQATLRWADPLGLFWRQQSLPLPGTLDVLPGLHPLLLPELLRPLLSEGSLSRRLGLDDPISLRGVREYVPGDPPGRVMWKPTARTGVLTVREPERTAASSVCVFVDEVGPEVYQESAVRLAASLLGEAEGLGLPVSAATSAGSSPPGTGAAALTAALRRLALVGQGPPAPPQIPPTRPGANLFILTAQPGPDLVAQAMKARATASRVIFVALPEGFYLEPGEKPRRQWVAPPDSVRQLEAQAGALAESGILVFVLRGNQSVLRLGEG